MCATCMAYAKDAYRDQPHALGINAGFMWIVFFISLFQGFQWQPHSQLGHWSWLSSYKNGKGLLQDKTEKLSNYTNEPNYTPYHQWWDETNFCKNQNYLKQDNYSNIVSLKSNKNSKKIQ